MIKNLSLLKGHFSEVPVGRNVFNSFENFVRDSTTIKTLDVFCIASSKNIVIEKV